MIRPRPSANKKVLISVITAILVVVAIVIASFTAFGGSKTEKTEDPEITNPAEGPTVQTPQQTPPIFDDSPAEQEDPSAQNNPEVKPNEEDNSENQDMESQDPAQEDTPSDKDENESTDNPENPTESTSDSKEDNKPQTGDATEKDDKDEESQLVNPIVTQPTITVEKIWSGIRGCLGENPSVNMSLSAANLKELYGFDPSICQSFIAMKSGTIASPEEFLIAKATESNLSIIEQSCQQRQQALMQQWGGIGEYADILNAYQVVRSGEYLFFGISPNIAQLVGIFQGMMLAA